MERIAISQFAGFRDVTIETGPITVLIGPEASGKSVIAKLLYFFREIASRLPSAVSQGANAKTYLVDCQKRFCRYFPPENWGASGFSIKYECANQEVSILRISGDPGADKEPIDLRWSEFYGDMLSQFGERRQALLANSKEGESDRKDDTDTVWREELEAKMDAVLGPCGKFEQLFIPAGRAFFSQVQAAVFNTLEAGQVLDPFLVAFGALLERSKEVLKVRGFFDDKKKQLKNRPELRQTFSEILRGKFLREEKQDFLECSDGRRVRLAQASSGQQEVLPLLLVLSRFKELHHVRGRAVYIEEPEAHLFPTTQRKIVELMAETFRARHNEMSVIVTTHSPYILTALNNLLQAGQRYESVNDDTAALAKLQDIVPKFHVLKSREVVAYALRNGEAHSIISPETMLIDASEIDQVSTDIAIQFDQLLWGV